MAKRSPTTKAALPPSRPFLPGDWHWGLLLMLAVIVVYTPVWWAGYIWDDAALITANPSVVGPIGLKGIWTTSEADICPLTLTTFWAGYKVWGIHPLPFHLLSVLFHGAGAIVLWRVLLRLRIPGAWLGAALWALHPVMVESVAWVAETKNTESGFFYLLSILFYLKNLEDEPRPEAARRSYAFMLLFALLAMLAKASTVVLPVVLCLVLWWRKGPWNWRNVAKIAPVFALSLVVGLVSIWTQKKGGFDIPQLARSWPERLVTCGETFWFYLGKLAWPHPLIMVYPKWRIDAGDWVSWLPLAAVVLVAVVLWRYRASWSRPWFFAFAYFLAALLPVMGLLNMNYFYYSFVADHLQYLAAMGPMALLGAALFQFCGSEIPRVTVGGVVLLLLGSLSWRQAWIYQDERTLWTATLRANPACWVASDNLGAVYLGEKKLDEAKVLFQQSLEAYPQYVGALNNMGNVLLQEGHTDDAITQFQKALATAPDFYLALDNLGVAYVRKGREADAVAQFLEALRVNPAGFDSAYNLGLAYVTEGRRAEADKLFQQAIHFKPDYSDAINALGFDDFLAGRNDEAIGEFHRALAIRPDFVLAHHNLGRAFAQKGNFDDAIAEFQRTLQIDPHYTEAYNDWGVALARQGRLDEAIIQFQAALQQNPDYADARKNLNQAQTLLRQKGPH